MRGIIKTVRNLTFILLLLFSTTPVLAQTQLEVSKLDPMLKMLSEKAISTSAAKGVRLLREVPGQEPMVRTIVRFKGDLKGVDTLGGKIGSIIGDIATVEIPLNSLESLSQLENIVYVEAAKPLKPQLDTSVPQTGADKLRGGIPPLWNGITGKNVIVGIVDSGIDLTHPDFKDAAGKSRILYLWDQTTGLECTNTTIDNGTCSEIDTSGHGTHVSGIAAGNGSASNYRYVGMAPEADIIFVKCYSDLSDFAHISAFTDDVLNGISYIQQKAAFLGKPSVINLSLGQHMDPHDGTSNYSIGLDNYSGPGKIIVGAAGNEADDGIHTSGYVSQGFQTLRTFDVLSSITSSTIDIWYSGSDSMYVYIATPICGNTDWIVPGTTGTLGILQALVCGSVTISSSLGNPNNMDKEIRIELQNPITGTWYLYLYGSSIINGRFDTWISPKDGKTAFSTQDSSMTLLDTAVTARVISVGSYVTRPYSLGDTLAGTLSYFSSLGPRRLCSTCSNVLKPDISAPGQWIMSAFSKDTRSPSVSDKDPYGGPYILDQGTSMSAPHVTGAVALLLQKNSLLTPENVKYYLFNTTVIDPYTGSVPNYTWGYGKLDIYNAYLAAPAENTFADVPIDHWAFFYARAIYHQGITVGCSQSPLMYCPENNVTRGQMAAFLVRSLYGENFTYTMTPYFVDVPATHTFLKYVQKLKDVGMTVVNGVYDVDGLVTRGQMAAFIVRARFGENFNYTAAPYFADVLSTHTFFKYVQKMKDEGLTAVTGTYMVDNIVLRDQMAAFLSRAFLGMK